MESQNFVVQGAALPSDEKPMFVSGGAVVIGNEIVISGSITHERSPEKPNCSGNLQSHLDISTLNGTWWAITDCFDNVDKEFGHDYSAGTVTLTACP